MACLTAEWAQKQTSWMYILCLMQQLERCRGVPEEGCYQWWQGTVAGQEYWLYTVPRNS